VPLCRRRHRAAGLCEPAGFERAIGNEADPVRLALGEHVRPARVGEVERELHGGDVDDRPRRRLLEGNGGIGRVQLVEVKPIDLQASQRALAGNPQMLWAAVRATALWGSSGGPQVPLPVIRIAPKPRRLTTVSPWMARDVMEERR